MTLCLYSNRKYNSYLSLVSQPVVFCAVSFLPADFGCILQLWVAPTSDFHHCSNFPVSTILIILTCPVLSSGYLSICENPSRYDFCGATSCSNICAFKEKRKGQTPSPQGWWGGVGVEKRSHTWALVVSLRIINLTNTMKHPWVTPSLKRPPNQYTDWFLRQSNCY